MPVCREIGGDDLAKTIQANNTLSVILDALRITVAVPPMAGAILRLIDGKRSVGDIGALLAARGTGAEVFTLVRRVLFPALEGINRLLLAAPNGGSLRRATVAAFRWSASLMCMTATVV